MLNVVLTHTSLTHIVLTYLVLAHIHVVYWHIMLEPVCIKWERFGYRNEMLPIGSIPKGITL